MRAGFRAIAPLFAALALGCTTVDPDECWPNTSGGFGGSGGGCCDPGFGFSCIGGTKCCATNKVCGNSCCSFLQSCVGGNCQ